MLDKQARKEILATRKPTTAWPGEPWLGSIYGEEEIDAAVTAIRNSMNWTEGFGYLCREHSQFEEAFAKYVGAADSVSINGAGTGIDMAMRHLELQPGDEVICPAVNFRAVPMSIIAHGGKVVYGEIDPRTFQLDPNDVLKRLTSKTRAIVPTHMNGLSAPMDDYLEIAEKYPHPKYGPLKVIGDAARAVGGSYKGEKIGKKGWMTIFSFHTQKNMTTLGEGGAITTDDAELANIFRGYRQFGFEHDGWGTNYKLTRVQAAVGLVQLRRLDDMIRARRHIAQLRSELLKDTPELTLPYEPADCEHTYYLYTILVPDEWAGEKRDRLMAMMLEDYNVECLPANPPVNEHSAYLRKHTGVQPLPVSEQVAKRLFCPPIHPAMTPEQNEYVCAALIETVERIRELR